MESIDIQHKNKNIQGFVGSLTFHLIFMLIAYFGIVWDKPDPPLPEYGVELNFGLDAAGFGEIQTMENPGNEQSASNPAPNPEAQEQSQPTEPQDVPNETPITDQNSTEEIFVPKEEPKVNPEPKKTNPEPAKPVNENSLYGSSNNAQGNNNNGDKPGSVGDQGNPKGSLDAKALYGNPGSGNGGGASLDMNGWRWDKKPKVDDQSVEEGKIVFQIKVDENGEIVSVITLEKTVSPSVEKIYRQEVEKLSFSPTTDNSSPAPISTGKITFLIRSR